MGFEPESFWDQTFRTVGIAFHAKLSAYRREHNHRAWLAWHIAAMQRQKKLPKLKSMYAKEKPRVQSWQEQSALMRQWAAAHNAKLGHTDG